RIGGQDRYGTAAKTFHSVASTKENVDSVVLSGGGDYPDALSANFLAGQLDTGTLLTKPNKLSQAAFDEIIEHGVKHVYITGGTTAVSKDVYKKLRNTRVGDKTVNPYIQVTRLGGKDRYATNKKINQYTQPGFPSTSERALVATGTGFADAVAMGPIAYSDNAPLILVRGDSLGTSAQNQLEEFSPKLVAIAGGERSVSSSVEESIKDMSAVDIVRRYAGDDRTGTAAAIAEWAAGQGDEVDDLEYNEDTVLLANGAYYADALVAGPLSGS